MQQQTHNSAPLRVISRDSQLALLQVEELFRIYAGVPFALTAIKSFGDCHKHISLMTRGLAADFFTRELDRAILSGEYDIAVHSAKDLPYPLPAGLAIYALTEAQDKSDSLVSRDNLRLAELPSGARIGTSSTQRKAELQALRPDLEVVPIRGNIGERIALVDNGTIDALIVASCALDRLGLADRRTERLPFRTHPLQGNLAVVGREGRADLETLFAEHDIRREWGRVTLVGFGPGNPDLLTLGGDRALRQADVIFHDDLLDKAFLEQYAGEKVYVGKRDGRHSHGQDEINELVYRTALDGKNVVRLKGGDPMVFAHGREEYDFLRERLVEVDIVPGVSAGIALASATKIPLTARGVARSVSFALGHGSEVPAPLTDTVVYYMGGRNLSTIAASLLASGRDAATPVAIVTNVSLADQRTYFASLGELRYSLLLTSKPAILIVGKVVDYERRAARERVLVTSTQVPQSVTESGASVVHTPLIRLERNDFEKGLDDEGFDYVVFTSRYGAEFFCGSQVAETVLRGAKVVSVGPVTSAALAGCGVSVDYESPSESAEGVVEYFRERGISNARILLPRSNKGIALLPQALRELGNSVVDLAVYRNTPNTAAQRVDLSLFDRIIFASPSGVDAFVALYDQLPPDILLTARGATTFASLRT